MLHIDSVVEVTDNDLDTYLLQLSGRLAALGHRVLLFTLRAEAAQEAHVELAPGLTLYHVDAGAPDDAPDGDRLDEFKREFAARVVSIVRDLDHAVDVVYSRRHHGVIPGFLVTLGLQLPLWRWIHYHQDLSVTTYQVRQAWPVTLGSPWHARVEEERRAARYAHSVVNTPNERDAVLAYLSRRATVHVIPAVVTTDAFPISRRDARRALNPQLKGAALQSCLAEKVLLHAGDFDEVAGQLILLAAFSTSRADRLVLAGDFDLNLDHDRKAWNCAELIRIRTGKKIDVLGRLSQENLRRCMAVADLYVSAARDEAFGLNVLNAMAAGLPVVAATGGGHSFTVRSGLTGFLVDRDPTAFQETIDLLLTRPDVRKRMAERAWRHVRDNFSWDCSAALHDALIREVVAGSPSMT
ncbi:glycosyltransferase [Deinococcus pimensis]|uniref:glycosyltransferase n=1 Tax=Deinococcus pimensis TaxID=309888 RepID=UPI00146F9A62|nr:glycosyltransferase [Deinococcus pimensis]